MRRGILQYNRRQEQRKKIESLSLRIPAITARKQPPQADYISVDEIGTLSLQARCFVPRFGKRATKHDACQGKISPKIPKLKKAADTFKLKGDFYDKSREKLQA